MSPITGNEIAGIIHRYGDLAAFVRHFDINKSVNPRHYPELIASDRYPTLTHINMAYGPTTAVNIISVWLADLETRLGKSVGVLTLDQRVKLATDMVTHFGHLRITEFIIFFNEYRTGTYGHPYGSLDSITLCNALRQYMRERDTLITQYEQQQREKEQALERKNNPPVSWDEYKRRHNITAENPLSGFTLGK